jgi:hypothetical protein
LVVDECKFLNEGRQVVKPNDYDPGFMVLPVKDDRDMTPGVGNGLVECFVEAKTLRAFALDMNVRDVGDDVRRIGAAPKLNAAPGVNTQHARQLMSEFTFANLALIA